MFMNLDTIPAGQAMYTVAVTDIEPGTVHRADMYFDEVDVVTSSRATVDEIIAAADLSGYEGQRILGVVNQSDGFIVLEDAWLTRVVA
jgi:hypothetical protein